MRWQGAADQRRLAFPDSLAPTEKCCRRMKLDNVVVHLGPLKEQAGLMPPVTLWQPVPIPASGFPFSDNPSWIVGLSQVWSLSPGL